MVDDNFRCSPALRPLYDVETLIEIHNKEQMLLSISIHVLLCLQTSHHSLALQAAALFQGEAYRRLLPKLVVGMVRVVRFHYYSLEIHPALKPPFPIPNRRGFETLPSSHIKSDHCFCTLVPSLICPPP